MHQSNARFKIADSVNEIPFNEKNISVVEIDGKKICLIKIGKELKACANRCPHAGGNLSEGFVDKQLNIVCPVHHYRFSLLTGRDALNEGYFLKRYKVEISSEGVFIEL